MTAKEAQNILELEAPFTVVELKSAHKNALVAWFPAQFMSDRAQLTKALERTDLIHQAYEVLLAHCEAEKAAATNPFVEEAMKQAYGQAPSSHSRAESLPEQRPVLESQPPAPLEAPPRAETALTSSEGSSEAMPEALRFEEPVSEGGAQAPKVEAELVPPLATPAPSANPFFHEIVPLKVTMEAPKVELRGRATAPLDSAASPDSSTSPASSLAPRTDAAITKVRPPKVVISPRLRGAIVQPAIPAATVPVPLPPLSAPIPAGASSSPPPVALGAAPLLDHPPVEESVRVEAFAPETAVAAAPPVQEEVEPVLTPSTGGLDKQAGELKAPPAPTLEPPAPVQAEARAVAPEPEAPATLPVPVPIEVKEAAPEAMPVLERQESTPVPLQEGSAPPVDKPEAPAEEDTPPSSPPATTASLESASSAVQTRVSDKGAEVAEPVHAVPAALAEEASAVAQASHHAPVASVPAPSVAAATQAANHAPAPIARPQISSAVDGKSKADAEGDAEADDEPVSDHALIPALGDRYHPAEREASPNTDTTRHFPTRPFAPSSGTVPIHEEGKSASALEIRPSDSPGTEVDSAPRPLSVGQRILRFVLAVLCVGGVGYGIYFVSQTNLGRDPWGKEPGSGGPIDRLNHQVLENLKRDAEDGIARAQYDLAKVYQNGKGVPENAEEALKWFRKAAEQGHMDAQYAVGDAYKNGRGVPQDNAEALKWYRMAEATREEQRGETKEKGKEAEEDLRLQ